MQAINPIIRRTEAKEKYREQVYRAITLLLNHRLAPETVRDPSEVNTAYRMVCRWVVRILGGLLLEARKSYWGSPLRQGWMALIEELSASETDKRKREASAWPHLLELLQDLYSTPLGAETECFWGEIFPSDELVHRILVLLAFVEEDSCEEKQQLTFVDFKNWSGEQLGLLYQDLLDYKAPTGGRIRESSTRKGEGIFYTPSLLTLPTVRRTLEPLLVNDSGMYRNPEDLLQLKICDPAMGAGSFLLASLHVLMDAVIAARLQHGYPPLTQEARRDLRYAIVTRCLYGVDKDPSAVDLAQITLWIEIGDPDLPLQVLHRSLRCGDALLGTWSNYVQEYPMLAWWRQSPDDGWVGATHKAGFWSKQLKELRVSMAEEQRKILTGELPTARAYEFKEESLQGVRRDEIERAKEAFDIWCALWFWPLDQLATAPRPGNFQKPTTEALTILREVRSYTKFFHWELEFSDIFSQKEAGFDAIVTNPPWEMQKPSCNEFFSDYDPNYNSRSKQEALRWQREEFQREPKLERAWLTRISMFNNTRHFVHHAAEPFGDRDDARGLPLVSLAPRKVSETRRLHAEWSAKRKKYDSRENFEYPFRYQGTEDLNSYKLFLELSHVLLKRGGQLGIITPSGLLTDKGTFELRRLFLEHYSWRWSYGFENRDQIFDIHRNFRFTVTIAEKGGRTEALRAAFLRRDIEDWVKAKNTIVYTAKSIRSFNPQSLSLLELDSQRDLEILAKIHHNSIPLGDTGPEGWGIRYANEFHLTNDSRLFLPREEAEVLGYQADSYGRWIHPDGDILLPLYEGRMLGAFDLSRKGWIRGKGRSAIWRNVPWENKTIEPQFLLRYSDFQARCGDASQQPRVAFMDVTAATNTRTMIAALLPAVPCGNSAPALFTEASPFALCAVLNSYVYDFAVRARCGGQHLPFFVLEESPLLPRSIAEQLVPYSMALSWSKMLAPILLRERSHKSLIAAMTRHERLRIRCILDAIIAVLYGLSREELRWILRDCDHPKERLANKAFCRSLDPKGFWHVAMDEDPELRPTVLTWVALDALMGLIEESRTDHPVASEPIQAGINAFLALNSGDGWRIPETLCLADHGLGHDNRAHAAQPVAARLGPRFLDWQINQTVDTQWRECEQHAHALLEPPRESTSRPPHTSS